MKQLLISYVDETGDSGFTKKNSSRLYGVSFVFCESNRDFIKEINHLKEKLRVYNFNYMIHTNELVRGKNEYSKFDIPYRKKIFYIF